MGFGVQRPAALEALLTKLHKLFMEGQRQSFAAKHGFFQEFPSDTKSNTYGWLAGMTGMREWIGARHVEALKERSYTIVNKPYEKTLGVLRDAIEDGMLGDAEMAMSELVKVVNNLDDDLLLALMEGGQAATVAGLAYDGQYFYDTDHPISLDSTGTQRNYYASGLALDATNLKAAIAAMMAFKGESGNPFGVGQAGLVLTVPPGLWGAALDAAEAKTVSTGGENIIATKMNVTPVVWARLGTSTRWFLNDLSDVTPGPKPFMIQRRRKPTFVTKTAPTDDNVFMDRTFLFGADARVGAGYGAWQKSFSAAA